MAKYKFTWENIVKRYNKVMNSCCFEHVTIGTCHTQVINGRDPNKFNEEDILAEAKERRQWYEPMETRDIALASPEDRLYLLNEKRILDRFIAWMEKGLADRNH